MKNIQMVMLLSMTMFLGSCSYINNLLSIKEREHGYPGLNSNVCKTLKGNVVLYAIFVDSKTTQPWTEYDITSTLDSIHIAKKWIEDKAKANGVTLNIIVDYYKNGETIPIEGTLPKKSLGATLSHPNGVKKLDKWADLVAKTAGQTFIKDTSKVVKVNPAISDRERLIARLRDIHKTDNVALMYFINNFYKNETSVAIHSNSHENIEYAIVSFKHPGSVAHEFLHLFGADDLYISHRDHKRKMQKKKKLIMREFPNEIMAFNYKRIETLDISPITKFLIGWEYQLDPKYHKTLFGKNKPVSY